MVKQIKTIFFGIILIALTLFISGFANAQVFPCSDMFELGYPSSDLNIGDNFNLTLLTGTDVIGNNAWLAYPAGLSLVSGNIPQQIQLVSGSGKALWTLHTLNGGNQTVTVTVSLNSTQNCTISETVLVIGATNPQLNPNIIVTPQDLGTVSAQKTPFNYSVSYQNTGTGNAINVTTTLSDIYSNTFGSPFNLDAGILTTKYYGYAQSSWCGARNLRIDTTYKNLIGVDYNLTNYDSFNVSGSDLQITAVYLPQTSYYNGQTINATVSITNNNQSVHGIIPEDASNVTVYFDDYRCSSVGSIAIWGVQNFSCSYRISETFSSTRTVNYVVRVEANNDCMNYASLTNYKTRDVAIIVRIPSTGGGGSGGDDDGSTGGSTYVSICGNKICEVGENTANCATDCGQPVINTNTTGQTSNENGLYVYSDDGKAFIYLQSGTKTFMDKMPILNPREWIIIEYGNVTTKVPYGISMIRQYEFIPNGLEFIPDATLSLKYSQLELKNGVYLMYFNSEEEKWIFIDAVVDSNNQLISSKVGHFSNYALVTKENYPILTGFVLIDSMIGFVSQNLLWDAIILGAIILAILLIIFLSNRKDRKNKKK